MKEKNQKKYRNILIYRTEIILQAFINIANINIILFVIILTFIIQFNFNINYFWRILQFI